MRHTSAITVFRWRGQRSRSFQVSIRHTLPAISFKSEWTFFSPLSGCGGYIYGDGAISFPNLLLLDAEITECIWYVEAGQSNRATLLKKSFVSSNGTQLTSSEAASHWDRSVMIARQFSVYLWITVTLKNLIVSPGGSPVSLLGNIRWAMVGTHPVKCCMIQVLPPPYEPGPLRIPLATKQPSDFFDQRAWRTKIGVTGIFRWTFPQ